MTRQPNPQSKPEFAPMLAPTVKPSDAIDPSGTPRTATSPTSDGTRISGEPLSDEATRHAPGEPLVAAEQLLEEHYDSVYRYAFRLTGSSAGAEDVAQEVFVRAIKSLHQLRELQAARGWLLVIARNEFARWCRKFAPQSKTGSPLTGDECSLEAGPASQLDREDWVQRSMMELPVEHRVVVSMFYFEQLSYAEIAQELEIPIGTVMSRLSRAKKQLKDALLAFAEPYRRESSL